MTIIICFLLSLININFTPQDGSILFVENGNRIVQRNTNSTLTHVATIVIIDDEPWVYEAVPPKVRKIRLSEYYQEINKINKRKKIKLKVWIANPKNEITKEQKEKYLEYLESQIDRKYSVLSYVNGEENFGIHCCEMTGNALDILGNHYTENPKIDSPRDVWVKTKEIYSGKIEVK
jgi:hypothetical protein